MFHFRGSRRPHCLPRSLAPAASFLYSCRKVANEERRERRGARDSGSDATANLPMDTDGGRSEGGKRATTGKADQAARWHFDDWQTDRQIPDRGRRTVAHLQQFGGFQSLNVVDPPKNMNVRMIQMDGWGFVRSYGGNKSSPAARRRRGNGGIVRPSQEGKIEILTLLSLSANGHGGAKQRPQTNGQTATEAAGSERPQSTRLSRHVPIAARSWEPRKQQSH